MESGRLIGGRLIGGRLIGGRLIGGRLIEVGLYLFISKSLVIYTEVELLCLRGLLMFLR